ncbi:MAG: DUF2156 domain-containing protein [Clostridiales bacterium]|nr:DUF2156 domain-containing protein [Clostridiales bacterium]
MTVTKSPEALSFHKLSIEDRDWAVPLLRSVQAHACEYSFTTLYMWRRHYHNRIAREGDTLFVRSGVENPFYLLPAGGDEGRGLDRLRAHASLSGKPCVFYLPGPAAERLNRRYPGAFDMEPSPNDFDYLYDRTALAELPGKKYHQKRNHISAFSREHAWRYEPLDDGNAPEAAALAEEWCREKGRCQDPGLRSEHCAIREALQLRRELSLTGALIRVEGRPVAFTFGSPISGEVFDIHVEKALAGFSAAYTVINREFASRALAGYRYINRENDLGIEGLRRAKRSYHPAMVLEKYLCRER